MSERTFNVGDQVWAYIPPSPPQAGVVERIGYRSVWIADDLGRSRIYYPGRIFHRPAERQRLLAEMDDDASAILRAAQRIAQEDDE